MRTNNRANDEIRPVTIFPDYSPYAEGSALIDMGNTRIVATASLDERVPPFLKGNGTGWVTAEYAMLPRATEKRTARERTMGRLSGRTQEIQRLIGRCLRAVTDLRALGERTIIIDCDVIQADGGTRTAAITSACVALALCLKKLMDEGVISELPLKSLVSGVSVGIVGGQKILDLDYREDSSAEVDMNIVETDSGQIVEIQATAEKKPFTRKDFNALLKLGDKGIHELIQVQRGVLKEKSLMFMAFG